MRCLMSVMLSLGLGMVGIAAHAEIYRTVDAQGNVIFSDTPSKNAERVQLPPLTIVPRFSAETIAGRAAAQRAPVRQNYQISFISPTGSQVFQKPQDTIEIAVNISPDLGNGDQVFLLLNNANLGEGATASVPTESLDRGTHTVVARVVNTAGRVLTEQSTTVVVQQPSKLMPNRTPPKR